MNKRTCNRLNIRKLTCLPLFIALLCTSCMLRMLQPPPTPAVLEEQKLPGKVAIIPFVNKTTNPDAAKVVRKMFYNFFSSLNYRDLEPYVIDDTLRRNKLYQKITSGDDVSPKTLGQLLGVDAVIFGEVHSLGKIYALVYSDNQAGLKAQMVSCHTEQVIWELEHTIHLEEGDIPLSPLGLATTVLKTAINHQQASHLKAASELCMQMVATIPNPPAVTDPPPKIEVLVHNGAGKLLRPGNYLRVAMIGDHNQVASWSIPPLFADLPMKEQKPGVYIGAYRVKPQDRLPHGRLIGYLRSKKGVGSQWMDTLGPIKIGEPTLLPSAISKDMILSVDHSPYLVKDALVVKPGAKLTVSPGTVVCFQSLGLIVKGELQILGTKDNPVRLVSLDSSGWKGIFLVQSRKDNTLSYCTISNAEFGFRAAKSKVSIQNCQFHENVWGIVLEEGSTDISSSLVRTSAKTGIAARQATVSVKASIITENGSGGFLLENSQARITQNNIENNASWEIKVLDNSGLVKAAHNWWGNQNPRDEDIIGPVAIQPVLQKPINFFWHE